MDAAVPTLLGQKFRTILAQIAAFEAIRLKSGSIFVPNRRPLTSPATRMVLFEHGFRVSG